MSVQTVLGPVDPKDLGHTLTHEHFSVDFTYFYRSPEDNVSNHYEGDFSLNNIGFVRQSPYCSLTNVQFYGTESNEAVLNDVFAYKKFGGGSIVENTTVGLKANISLLKSISEKTKVHVIAGTGYYIAGTQDPSLLTLKKEEMYEHMLNELTKGYECDPSVKAGFIGEIASVRPMHDFEKRAIQATGELQEQLGCGVSFHPDRNPAAPFEIIRLYLEAGGRANKAVMSHLDRTLLDDDVLLEFGKLGCYCQYDLFGTEVSYYQLNPMTDMPSDAQRIAKIQKLIDDGRVDKILISHDIHTRHRLIDFGGHGYSHIIRNVLPKMKLKGISDHDIRQISIENPADWLKFTSS